MDKTYRFRMYPNYKQKIKIEQILDATRFVYNECLSAVNFQKCQNVEELIKYLYFNLLNKHEFLKEINLDYLKKQVYILGNNLKKCKLKQGRCINFKSKYKRNSYYIKVSSLNSNHKNSEIKIDFIKQKINLPDIGWTIIKGYSNLKKINGLIKSINVIKEATGKYYISVNCEITNDFTNKINKENIVGIDLGVKTLATLSDGKIYQNNRYLNAYEKRLKRLQKNLGRKQKYSKNYDKTKRKLNILNSKLKNSRKFYIHKMTKEITDTYDIIICENITAKKMIMEKIISKSLSDASFAEILKQLEYKCRFKNKIFHKINSYYPSSQICSVCNFKDSKYKDLNQRIFLCKKCGSILDRDLNASINIKKEGIKMLN